MVLDVEVVWKYLNVGTLNQLKDIFPDTDEDQLLSALEGSDFELEGPIDEVLNQNEKGWNNTVY